VAKPAILTVDDDPAVSAAVARDLRRKYGAEYQIYRATSGAEALDVLRRLALRGRPVALMPRTSACRHDRDRVPRGGRPCSRRQVVPLTAYADTAHHGHRRHRARPLLLKPWDPPEERLYPVLDDLPSTCGRAPRRRPGRAGGRARLSSRFLTRNHVPYRWLDLERDGRPAGWRSWPARGGHLPSARAGRGAAARTLDPRPRRGARAAHPRRATPLRPVHRRGRAGRAGGGGVRGVGGPADRRHRAGGPRRPGRSERRHRELPRLPPGPLRCRPHAVEGDDVALPSWNGSSPGNVDVRLQSEVRDRAWW
jgi:CheY-like chemotaxis protein